MAEQPQINDDKQGDGCWTRITKAVRKMEAKIAWTGRDETCDAMRNKPAANKAEQHEHACGVLLQAPSLARLRGRQNIRHTRGMRWIRKQRRKNMMKRSRKRRKSGRFGHRDQEIWWGEGGKGEKKRREWNVRRGNRIAEMAKGRSGHTYSGTRPVFTLAGRGRKEGRISVKVLMLENQNKIVDN